MVIFQTIYSEAQSLQSQVGLRDLQAGIKHNDAVDEESTGSTRRMSMEFG
jgi:hypothetical protein